jgi:hypothetical protein
LDKINTIKMTRSTIQENCKIQPNPSNHQDQGGLNS